MALRFVDSIKISMEQASKQAGVSMIMVEGVVHTSALLTKPLCSTSVLLSGVHHYHHAARVVHPAQTQLLKITF